MGLVVVKTEEQREEQSLELNHQKNVEMKKKRRTELTRDGTPQLINIPTEAYLTLPDHLPNSVTASSSCCAALAAVRDSQFHSPTTLAPLVTTHGAMKDTWVKAKNIIANKFPVNISTAQTQLRACLAQENPTFAVNELAGVRRVNIPGDPLHGQFELYFLKKLSKGIAIPFPGELVLVDEDPSKYELGFDLGFVKVVLRPDLQSAAPYCNDYAGPDRSSRNKSASRSLLNLEFQTVGDVWGRPYNVLKTTRDVEELESGWVDYGDDYWSGHAANNEGLSEESRVWVAASEALVVMKGTCADNPIDN